MLSIKKTDNGHNVNITGSNMSKDRTRTGPKPKPTKRAAAVVSLIPKVDPIASTLPAVVAGYSQNSRQEDPTNLFGLANYLSARCTELLRHKGDLTDDEKAYLFDKLETMKDEKLKSIITGLVGWGDDERAELETTISVLLQVMRTATPKQIRSAAMTVEYQSLMKQIEG